MSLGKRLEWLEVLAGGKANPSQITRTMELFFHALENARRELEGLEPLPPLRYTAEDLADDEWVMREVIPRYRSHVGYQSGQGLEFMDGWEQSVRADIEKFGESEGETTEGA